MNTDNQPNPDDGYRKAWKQAFDEAAETPPPRVWNAIERELDSGNRARIIPLWANVRPWGTGIAAAVAVILTGWWAWRAMVPGTPATDKELLSVAVAKTEQRPNRSSDAVPAPVNHRGAVNMTLNKAKTTTIAKADVDNELKLSATRMVPNGSVTSRPSRSHLSTSFGAEPGSTKTTATLMAFGQTNIIGAAFLRAEPVSSAVEFDRLALSVEELSGKSFRNRQLAIQRVVWFRNDDPIAVEPEKSTPGGHEKWASLSIMPSSYNPAVAVQSQSPSVQSSSYLLAASNRLSQTASSSLRSEAGAAVTLQLSAGTQLSDRWSIETGVGYLQARSTVVSPVQVNPSIAVANTDRTFYSTAVQNAISRNGQAQSAYVGNVSNDGMYVQTALYDSQKQASTRSDYSFVQVPVQMGYQLRPRRKLGLSLLGGLLTNWFVRNSVGETLVVKPSDNVYKEMTLAGTAGARFRYRSTRHWSASVAGVYQQSLQLGTQSDVSLETRPHTVGVSFGMDYHF